MRALGLDIGSVRVGVAVSDPAGAVASPVTVLDASDLDSGRLARIVEDYEAEMLVVGLPLTLAGEEGPQAALVRDTAERLAARLGLPLAFADERNSSAEAKRAMRSAGMSDKQQRGMVDKVAAALVLQSWLDAGHGRAES
ncbi:MAG: Holliday junction resolvase RuvX [Coriobacteriia bacterium]|nr:Holliday junction resolvase RuvX [Coriobacteriia bacterium]